VGLHCVDFHATTSHPLKRLIWGITGKKPTDLSDVPNSEKPATMREAGKSHLLPSRDGHAGVYKEGFAYPEARLYPPLAESPNQGQAAQLEILRRRVKEYWVDGVLEHSLYSEVLISLGKRQIDTAVDAPWKYTVEVSDAVITTPLNNRDVGAIYDATGLLLILGEPGSGKTTTLLDLARTLLDRAGKDIRERVPIVLNLSSWKKQPLVEWISGELLENYRVPRKIAKSWLQNNYLPPLLDGLDEVETTLQPDCVTAINAFIEEFNPSGLVVCCRLNEYRWLPERLKLNGAICLEPLGKDEVAAYFTRGGPELAALRKAVNTDPVLQELTQTPLMLSVMSLAYQWAGDDELATQKWNLAEDRRRQIFRLYVEQMFQRKGTTSLVFPKDKTISWLSWLAQKMRRNYKSVFLIEELQPGDADKTLFTYGIILALSLGVIYGLIAGLGCGPRFGLIAGLALFVGIGLGWQWTASPFANAIISGLMGGLCFGLIYPLKVGLIVWLIIGLIVGLIGLYFGLLAGLYFVLLAWARRADLRVDRGVGGRFNHRINRRSRSWLAESYYIGGNWIR
jgi:hypothetical protein